MHPSVDGHLDCFHVLASVNSAAVNIGVHVCFQICVLVSFIDIPRSGVAGSYGGSTFNFLRKPDIYICVCVCLFTVGTPVYIPTNSV